MSEEAQNPQRDELDGIELLVLADLIRSANRDQSLTKGVASSMPLCCYESTRVSVAA